MKLLWFILAMFVLSACSHSSDSNRSVKDISEVKPANQHVGRTFTTKYDLYVCDYSLAIVSGLPQIKVPRGVIENYGYSELSYPADPGKIGNKFKNHVVVDILPVGTNLRIDRILYYSEPTSHEITLILKTDYDKRPYVQYLFGASIRDSGYLDFRLGDIWLLGKVADEIYQKTEKTRPGNGVSVESG